MEKFTPELIAGVVGVFLTIVFAYFPWLRVRYGELKSETKSAIMLGLYLVATVTIYLLGLYGQIPVQVPLNWYDAVAIFFTLVVIGQPTYTILPQAGDVKTAKMLRDYAEVEKTFEPK